jgi:hypothetical protein
MKLAEEFNVAVYLTNQVVSDPGGAMTFVQDPKVLLYACAAFVSVFVRNQSAATSWHTHQPHVSHCARVVAMSVLPRCVCVCL